MNFARLSRARLLTRLSAMFFDLAQSRRVQMVSNDRVAISRELV
jgi:hypothetical protein